MVEIPGGWGRKRRPPAKSKVYSETVYQELHAGMKALRDTEFRLVALFYEVSAFIVTGNVVLIASDVSILITAISTLLSVLLLIGFWCRLCVRIEKDHETYRFLGDRVTAIREMWEVDDFFRGSDSNVRFGHGPGYKFNRSLISWSVAIVTAILMLTLLARVFEDCQIVAR